MGKISRLLLSRDNINSKEKYFPSKDKNRKTDSSESRIGLKERRRTSLPKNRERRR